MHPIQLVLYDPYGPPNRLAADKSTTNDHLELMIDWLEYFLGKDSVWGIRGVSKDPRHIIELDPKCSSSYSKWLGQHLWSKFLLPTSISPIQSQSFSLLFDLDPVQFKMVDSQWRDVYYERTPGRRSQAPQRFVSPYPLPSYYPKPPTIGSKVHFAKPLPPPPSVKSEVKDEKEDLEFKKPKIKLEPLDATVKFLEESHSSTSAQSQFAALNASAVSSHHHHRRQSPSVKTTATITNHRLKSETPQDILNLNPSFFTTQQRAPPVPTPSTSKTIKREEDNKDDVVPASSFSNIFSVKSESEQALVPPPPILPKKRPSSPPIGIIPSRRIKSEDIKPPLPTTRPLPLSNGVLLPKKEEEYTDRYIVIYDPMNKRWDQPSSVTVDLINLQYWLESRAMFGEGSVRCFWMRIMDDRIIVHLTCPLNSLTPTPPKCGRYVWSDHLWSFQPSKRTNATLLFDLRKEFRSEGVLASFGFKKFNPNRTPGLRLRDIVDFGVKDSSRDVSFFAAAQGRVGGGEEERQPVIPVEWPPEYRDDWKGGMALCEVGCARV